MAPTICGKQPQLRTPDKEEGALTMTEDPKSSVGLRPNLSQLQGMKGTVKKLQRSRHSVRIRMTTQPKLERHSEQS